MIYGNNGEKKVCRKGQCACVRNDAQGRRDINSVREYPLDRGLDQGGRYILVWA